MKERISAGNKAYFAHKIRFIHKTLSKKSMLKLYKSVIRPIVTHAPETWVLKKQIKEYYQYLKGKSEGSMGLLFTQKV
jgi:hypothetical protein